MRRLIVQEFVTLDGLAAGPNGEVDFIPAAVGDAGVAENQMRFIDTVETIVLGRATYEMFAGYWPTATGDDKPFADKLNTIPKLVFSRTLERVPWGSTLLRYEPS
jgi:dihydrofolate reductase